MSDLRTLVERAERWATSGHRATVYCGREVLRLLAPAPLDNDRVADGPCQECGTTYPAWWVEHAIWNRTMGGPDATGDPGGLLCPTCFLWRAEPVRGAWRIVPPEDAP